MSDCDWGAPKPKKIIPINELLEYWRVGKKHPEEEDDQEDAPKAKKK